MLIDLGLLGMDSGEYVSLTGHDSFQCLETALLGILALNPSPVGLDVPDPLCIVFHDYCASVTSLLGKHRFIKATELHKAKTPGRSAFVTHNIGGVRGADSRQLKGVFQVDACRATWQVCDKQRRSWFSHW